MIAPEDPRFAELMRRRAARDGAAHGGPAPEEAPAPTPDPGRGRRLDDAGRAEVRALAAEHPGWSASDLADAFEAGHGRRPSYQAIGRCLAGPAPRKGKGRSSSGRPRATAAPDDRLLAAEVGAIAAVSRALAALGPAATRRVLDWAGARFLREEGGDS